MCCFLDYAETMSTNSYFWKNFRQGAASVRLFPSHLNYESELQQLRAQMDARQAQEPTMSSKALIDKIYQERYLGMLFVLVYMLAGYAGVFYLAMTVGDLVASIGALVLAASQVYINMKWQDTTSLNCDNTTS